mmetsp:Transcript_18897/g.22622  ORF Transcript_18897/g.22622 Transcript_18897/m.22622 type:complete len:110 (+) Transcript_18897:64-393(+)|eukprot:CAMPEP_0197848480 /NCGR_PEP_ID=MMETSP1438-20131217/8861_1 /TAXON_ID=1461541 /ORGANISM="Pterosperma sp., Strain CCMP1384" /LENGTH=109 /DNA_ID=CAMNT_0043460747 /DNA_START=64 /DNA_END=393 /DNA_ORIENTATION=+
MASHFCKNAARALRLGAAAPRVGAAPANNGIPPLAQAQLRQARSMGGGAHGAEGVTYKGATIYPAAKEHVYLSEFFGAMMWFWIFYRAKEDGDVFINGHAAHFEHDDHH